MLKFNNEKLIIDLLHSKEYFNKTCQATIPEYYRAEVVQGVDNDYINPYSDGWTPEEALNALKEENNLKTHVRAHNPSASSLLSPFK